MLASTSLRAFLAGLLVVSAVLFAVGSTIERHQKGSESTAATHQEGSGGESGGETTTTAHQEKGVTLLGINTESLGLEIIAILASLLLAAAAWLLRRRLVLLAIVGFGFVFAAGDVRELVHQISESHGGIAAIAAALIALHLAVTGAAATLLAERPDKAWPA